MLVSSCDGVHVCVCVEGGQRTTQESFFSFHHAGPGEQTQAIKLGDMGLMCQAGKMVQWSSSAHMFFMDTVCSTVFF